jgi:integrase
MSIYSRGNIWYIDYYVSGKRVRETIGANKKLAENILRKRLVEVTENKHLDIHRQKKIKFEEFANTFLDLHSKPNKKSWKSDFFNLNSLRKFFGGRYLFSITQRDIEEYKAKRKEGLKPATVNRELATLKTLFTKAIQWGVLRSNPAGNVRFFKENNCRLRYLEKEEINKLIQECSARLRPIIIVALNTGMRRGEIFNLKWRDIDFQNDVLHLLDTKNGDKREVFINTAAKKALISVRKHPESPYVFCKKDGTTYTNIRKSFLATLKKCGIINFRFHDLRHTFASQLVMSGIDLNTVRELLGHRDIKMTLRYAHLSPDHKRRAVEVLGQNIVTNWSQAPFSDISEKNEVLQPVDIY